MTNNNDQKTADAFAKSWNNLPTGSVYTFDQFVDWMAPLEKGDIQDRSVLELGCGNAALMVHLAEWRPSRMIGVDLGDSVDSGRTNLETIKFKDWELIKHDMVSFASPGYDVVYCIGVLHHLNTPKAGFDAVIRNTKKGGRFHCWVYAREGNGVIVYIVDPIRKFASKLPWWLTKYFIAAPLSYLYYLYAKLLFRLKNFAALKSLPLYEYSLWIAKREFAFFRHVAFDQLVTPQTTYLSKETVMDWLKNAPEIDQESVYIIMRNGNSWKFGGRTKAS